MLKLEVSVSSFNSRNSFSSSKEMTMYGVGLIMSLFKMWKPSNVTSKIGLISSVKVLNFV